MNFSPRGIWQSSPLWTQFLTVLALKSSIFWDIILCSLLKVKQCFRGIYHHLKGRTLVPAPTCLSLSLFFDHEKGWQYVRAFVISMHKNTVQTEVKTFWLFRSLQSPDTPFKNKTDTELPVLECPRDTCFYFIHTSYIFYCSGSRDQEIQTL